MSSYKLLSQIREIMNPTTGKIALHFMATALTLGCITAAQAQSKKQEAAAIRYARNISVSRVEKGMPLIRFDKWFRSLGKGTKLKVHYEVNDCGEQTGTSADRGRDFPMCVEAIPETEVSSIQVNMMVGTFKKGITMRRPVTRGIRVDEEGEEHSDFDSLAALEKFLRSVWGN
jgi:hypothetical protein